MRLFPAAIGAALIATVSACSTADPAPVVRTVLISPAVPAAARQPCRAPVTLPDQALSSAQATTYWGRDRASLRECEQRRAAAVLAATPGAE